MSALKSPNGSSYPPRPACPGSVPAVPWGQAAAPASPAPSWPSRALSVEESRDFLEMAEVERGWRSEEEPAIIPTSLFLAPDGAATFQLPHRLSTALPKFYPGGR